MKIGCYLLLLRLQATSDCIMIIVWLAGPREALLNGIVSHLSLSLWAPMWCCTAHDTVIVGKSIPFLLFCWADDDAWIAFVVAHCTGGPYTHSIRMDRWRTSPA